MRTLSVLVVVGLVALAGCSAPVSVGPVTGSQVPEQSRDVEGWERGYWHNESLSVDPEDGLNRTELDAVVARSMARVERVRGVEFQRRVDVEVVTRDEFANSSAATGSSDGSDWRRIHRNVRYEALFLIGERTDSGETRERNRQQSVQGYYSTTEDRVVIVSETETPRVPEGTLAQELFHAYQYRHLTPDGIERPVTADRIRAILSVIEGDANLVEHLYRQRCADNWTCLDGRPQGDGNGTAGDDSDGGGVHMGLYLLQYFPYAEGEQFVREVKAAEGWDGVDRLYRDLPASTAQVIHDGDRPSAGIELPAGGGDGWSVVERKDSPVNYQTLGEAGLASMVAYTLYDDANGSSLVGRDQFLNLDNGSVVESNPLDYGLEPTDEWRGDRIRVYRNGEKTGYVWRIRFADAEAARQFAGTYRSLLSYHGAERVGDGRWRIDSGPFADAFYLDREGDTLTIVSAPSTSGLESIYPLLG